jgi:hypothetical protein
MAVTAVGKEEPHFPPPKRWSPDHPWGRPCTVDECREEHAPPSCALFKSKTPEERLAVVRRRELCILCFRHLDTKRCWSLGKVSNCNVRGCGRGHNYLLHDVLQNKEVMMVSALPRRVNGPESALRCRQMVAAENEGQCFRLNVLYDWGATVSMISEEAVEVMGLAVRKQAKRIIKGLGSVTTVSKGTCILSLVARNGDRKTVTAWEVGEIASLPGGQPPEDLDEQFPGLRYLSEPNCLIQRAGPVHVLLGMDHAHLMPEHVAESTDLSSQLRLMSSMFGGQHKAKEHRTCLGLMRWTQTKGMKRPPTEGRRGKNSQDGAGGKADSPQAHAQATKKAMGRREGEVSSHNEGKTSRQWGVRSELPGAQDAMEGGAVQPVHAGRYSGYAPCGHHPPVKAWSSEGIQAGTRDGG